MLHFVKKYDILNSLGDWRSLFMFAHNGKGTSIDNDELSIGYLVEDLMLSLGFRNSLVGRTYLRDCLVEVLLVDKHTVKVNDEEIKLTFKEFELLAMLMKHKEKVFGREEILETIWGYDFDGETRTVDVHVRHLRAKLGDDSIIAL